MSAVTTKPKPAKSRREAGATASRRKRSGCGESVPAAASAAPAAVSVPAIPAHDSPELAHITPALRSLAVPIESVKLDPRNARKHGDRNRASIRFSLAKFGQQKPISVDADGIILAGNGTFSVAQGLGWNYIAVVRSHLRGDAARAFAIADNRTAELAEWDVEELREQLDEIQYSGIEPGSLQFTDDEIDALFNQEYGADAEPSSQATTSKRSAGPAGGEIREQFKLLVNCESQAQRHEEMQILKAEGRRCRVLDK